MAHTERLKQWERIVRITLLLAVCGIVGVTFVSADPYVGGIPLETVSEGTVSGGVFIDAYPGFDTRAEKSFSLPEYSKIRWARLYVAVYCGNMENNYPGIATVEFNGGNGWQTLGTETLNVPYSFPGKGGTGPVMVNSHCSRVSSDYLIWYDVPASISSRTVSARVRTEKLGGTGSFDGRIKTITLVTAYDDKDQDQVSYWILHGHDMDSYRSEQDLQESYTGEFTIDTSSIDEEWDQASLHVAYLASRDADYTFNDEVLDNGVPTGAYFGMNQWDVAGILEAGQESVVTYENQPNEYYKIFLATLSIRFPEPDTGSLAVYTSPSDATIFIDGVEQETHSNTTITGLAEGVHRVYVEKEGYFTTDEASVNIERGKTEKATFTLKPHTGQIKITSEPSGAAVLLDGSLQPATTECTLKDIAVGEHKVTIRMSGYQDMTQEVQVEEGETLDLSIELVPTSASSSETCGGSEETSTSLVEGYIGRELKPVFQGSVHGNLSIVYAGDYSGLLSSGDTKDYSFSIKVPEQATLHAARMYVYTTWTHDERARTGDSAQCGITLNGKTLPIETRYLDRKGAGTYDYPAETLASNLSADRIKDGKNDLTITNAGGGDHVFAVYGAVLVLAWEEPDGSECHYWIAEGCDIILADPQFGVTTDEAVTTILFPGIATENAVEKAHLVVISTAASGEEETQNRILFNGAEWSNVLSGGSSVISRADLDIHKNLNSRENRLIVQSYAGDHAGDYLENRNAILLVRVSPGMNGVGDSLRINEPVQGPTKGLAPKDTLSEKTSATPVVLNQGERVDNSLIGSFFSGIDLFTNGIVRLLFGIEETDREEGSATAQVNGTPGVDDPVVQRPDNRSVTHTIRITSDPAGASVTLDGVPYQERTPLTVQNVPAGDHQLLLALEGCEPMEKAIMVEEDTETFIQFAGLRGTGEDGIELEDDFGLGGFYVESYPSGGEIFIDGSSTGLLTPHVVYGVREGSHTVKVTYNREGAEVYTTKAWAYARSLSRVELSSGNQAYRSIEITSDAYKGAYFTVDGVYPRYRIPAKVNVRAWQGFVTLSWNGTYLSIPVPATVADGGTFHIRPDDIPLVTFSVESEPAGARVFIDGFAGPSTPALIPNVSAGFHRIALALDDHIPVEQEILVIDDPGREIDASFRGVLVPYVAGSVSLSSNPEGALVYINNRNTGLKTPVEIHHLPIGKMLVKIKYEKLTREPDIIIQPGETVRYTAMFT